MKLFQIGQVSLSTENAEAPVTEEVTTEVTATEEPVADVDADKDVENGVADATDNVAPTSTPEEAMEEQFQLVTRTLNTIDSLESLLNALDVTEQAGLVMSTEEYSSFSNAVSLAYKMNGITEPSLLEVSTESLEFRINPNSGIALAREGVMDKIGDLVASLRGSFAAAKEKSEEAEKSIITRANEISQDIVASHRDVKVGDFGKEKVKLFQGTNITVNGKVDVKGTVQRMNQLHNVFTNDFAYFRLYLKQLQQLSAKMAKHGKEIEEKDKQRLSELRKQYSDFTVPSPFKETNSDAKHFRRFEMPVSDGIKVHIYTPTGTDRMVPSELKLSKPVVRKVEAKGLTKAEATAYLTEAAKIIEWIPSISEYGRAFDDIGDDVEKVFKEGYFKELDKELNRITTGDKVRAGIATGLSAVFLLGGSAGFGILFALMGGANYALSKIIRRHYFAILASAFNTHVRMQSVKVRVANAIVEYVDKSV